MLCIAALRDCNSGVDRRPANDLASTGCKFRPIDVRHITENGATPCVDEYDKVNVRASCSADTFCGASVGVESKTLTASVIASESHPQVFHAGGAVMVDHDEYARNRNFLGDSSELLRGFFDQPTQAIQDWIVAHPAHKIWPFVSGHGFGFGELVV